MLPNRFYCSKPCRTRPDGHSRCWGSFLCSANVNRWIFSTFSTAATRHTLNNSTPKSHQNIFTQHGNSQTTDVHSSLVYIDFIKKKKQKTNTLPIPPKRDTTWIWLSRKVSASHWIIITRSEMLCTQRGQSNTWIYWMTRLFHVCHTLSSNKIFSQFEPNKSWFCTLEIQGEIIIYWTEI